MNDSSSYQDAFERLLNAHLKPNRSGEAMTNCPLHDDRSPSLSINVKKGVWYCHAGCGHGSFKDLEARIKDGVTAPAKLVTPRLNQEVEKYHSELSLAARAYWHKRGIEDVTLDKMKIGFQPETGYYVIPYFDQEESCYAYKCIHSDKSKQEFWHPKDINFTRLYNPAAIQEVKLSGTPLVLAEGEKDALVLIQAGYSCLGIPGADGFKEEYGLLLRDVQDIVIVFDNDEAGRRGTGKIAEILGKKARAIDWKGYKDGLAEKFDINDLYLEDKENFKANLDLLLANAEQLTPEDVPAIKIHLMDIENSAYYSQKVEVDITIAGVGTAFFVPSEFEISWRETPSIAKTELRSGIRQFVIPFNSTILMKMCVEDQDRQYRDLEKFARQHFNFPIEITNLRVLEIATITHMIALPKMKELAVSDTGSIITEEGREYRQKAVYFLGVKDKQVNSYRATGYVVADPKTSEARLFITELSHIEEQFEEFRLTGDVRKCFEVFQRQEGESYEDRLNKLLDSIVYHYTKIHGEARRDPTLAYLLCYHSCLYFNFEGDPAHGWVQIAAPGDTTTGKSQIANKLRACAGAGVYVTGETCSRTGFLYAIDTKTLSSSVLKWGLLPQQDRGLLIIDGCNYISPEDWGTAREARRSGKLSVHRVVPGEHPCRTRLILLANPPHGKSLNKYRHPIECLKDIFQEPDIARLDLCVCFSATDVSQEEILTPNDERPEPELKITKEALRDSIYWAWSLKQDQIVFGDEAVRAVYDAAYDLQTKFGSACDIPLVSNDVKLKVARLAVAMAILLHHTDKAHEKVIVTPEIVQIVYEYLCRIYCAYNCRYDLYASDSKASTELSDADYLKISEAQFLEKEKDRSNIFLGILRILWQENRVKLGDLSAMLSAPQSTIKNKLKFFRTYGLIKSGRNGYEKTEKFNQYVKRTIKTDPSLASPPLPS